MVLNFVKNSPFSPKKTFWNILFTILQKNLWYYNQFVHKSKIISIIFYSKTQETWKDFVRKCFVFAMWLSGRHPYSRWQERPPSLQQTLRQWESGREWHSGCALWTVFSHSWGEPWGTCGHAPMGWPILDTHTLSTQRSVPPLPPRCCPPWGPTLLLLPSRHSFHTKSSDWNSWNSWDSPH